MKQTYFLGANSKRGFFSLYNEFPPARDAFLHILKSGPGTGKSGFLRRIAQAAEQKGLDVHTILCSGDPDSLDGVYVPELGRAWVDGTAPHVIEPKIFGADADYINLGAFFHVPFHQSEIRELERLQSAFKKQYDGAYQKLAEYASGHDTQDDTASENPLDAVITAIPGRAVPGEIRHRFLSAISCQGLLRLTSELSAYQILPCPAHQLEAGAHAFLQKGWNVILCHTPLDPERSEALLLPEAKLAFTAFPEYDETDPALRSGLGFLTEAKALHDEMEAIYKPHMHFSALDEYTEALISRLFETYARK